MTDPKRYNWGAKPFTPVPGVITPCMEENEEGGYVTIEDYNILEQKLKDSEDKYTQLKKAFDMLIH